MQNECFQEQRVAERLGVSRDMVRAWRKEHLQEGEGFRRDGREVILTQAGFDALCEGLGMRREAEKKEAADTVASLPVPVEMVVVSVPRNPHLVLAKKKGGEDGEVFRVRVRENWKFVPNMTIRVQETQFPGVYQLHGRGPRYKGRF